MNFRSLRERDIIRAIQREFSGKTHGLILGIGDDAAVIQGVRRPILLTTDLLTEGVHFISSLHPPYLLGRKALNVNLSDIAAMGGRPKFALLGVGLRRGMAASELTKFFLGFKAAAGESRTELIGGDISSSEKMSISVTVVGEASNPVRRSGAEPGDFIFVSGTLGDAAAGLRLLKKGHVLGRSRRADVLLRAFLDPSPKLSLGLALSQRRVATAMIDTSDGLSVDLLHLCEESRVGAEVYLPRLPISPEVRSFMKMPENLALHGGEDYQLLFTVRPKNLEIIGTLQRKYGLHWIGKMTKEKGIFLTDREGKKRPLEIKGYEHSV